MSILTKFPEPKVIELPIEKDAIVVDKRELDLEIVPAYLVAKVRKTMVECFEYDRVVKRVNVDTLHKKPIGQLIAVLPKKESAELLAQSFTDGRVWSDPNHNLNRYMHNRDIHPLVKGKEYDRRGPLFDAKELNRFLFENNGKIKEEWNLIDIPEEALHSDLAAVTLAEQMGVAPQTIRSRRRRLRIPPPQPGRMGGLLHALLVADYKKLSPEETIDAKYLEEYQSESPEYWQEKVEEYWTKKRKR